MAAAGTGSGSVRPEVQLHSLQIDPEPAFLTSPLDFSAPSHRASIDR